MTPALIAAAVQLANALADENKALVAMDLKRAATLVDAKTRALDLFKAAQLLATRTAGGAAHADQRAEAEQLAGKLRELADENRRLLENAMAVQGRVIGLVARAVGSASPQEQTRYGARGAPSGGDLRAPKAFSIGA